MNIIEMVHHVDSLLIANALRAANIICYTSASYFAVGKCNIFIRHRFDRRHSIQHPLREGLQMTMCVYARERERELLGFLGYKREPLVMRERPTSVCAILVLFLFGREYERAWVL